MLQPVLGWVASDMAFYECLPTNFKPELLDAAYLRIAKPANFACASSLCTGGGAGLQPPRLGTRCAAAVRPPSGQALQPTHVLHQRLQYVAGKGACMAPLHAADLGACALPRACLLACFHARVLSRPGLSAVGARAAPPLQAPSRMATLISCHFLPLHPTCPQNRKSDKSIANAMLVRELGELQYAHFTDLSPEEQLWGVHIDAELAAFTAAAAERRQRRVDAAVAQGADPATAAEDVDAEEDCGRLLLLRAAGRKGAAAASSEEEGGDVHYEAEEQPEEDEGTEQRQRKRRRHTQQQQPRERLETPLFQRQSRRATVQRGGQRAAAAVAAAAAELGGLGGSTAAGLDDLVTPSVVQRQQQRRQQEEEQEGTPRDRNACF